MTSVTLEDLMKMMREFVKEREWEPYQKAKDISISLSVEAAELLEKFQWKGDDEIMNELQDEKKLKEVSDEISDIILNAANLADFLEIDLSKAVLAKLEEIKKRYPPEKVKGKYIKK